MFYLRSFFWTYMFITIKFLFKTTFAVLYKVWYIMFLSIFICFKIFISFWLLFWSIRLFRSMLHNFHIFVNFPVFLLLLISSLILLWSENILCIISFSNLLRLILWSVIGSILENVPYVLGKNIYSAIGWNVLYNRLLGGIGVAQLVEHSTLNFGSSHDLTVHEFEPHIQLCTESLEPTWNSLSLSLPLPHSLSLSK